MGQTYLRDTHKKGLDFIEIRDKLQANTRALSASLLEVEVKERKDNKRDKNE